MSAEKHHVVYIMASKSRRLYTGVTSDLYKRVFQHKNDLITGFTMKYRIHRLVHYEEFTNISSAITREKQLKGWSRAKKIELIESENLLWEELAEHWYDDVPTFFGLRKTDPSLRSG
jgi:putative endonuclease